MNRTFNKQVTLIKAMEKNLKCFKNESELDLQFFKLIFNLATNPIEKKPIPFKTYFEKALRNKN